MATIAMIGAFDSKGDEYAYLRNRLLDLGAKVLAVNFGVLGSTMLFPVDVDSAEVAAAGGAQLAKLREAKDRGVAMKAMAAGAGAVLKKLHDGGRIDAVIGMGGTGGSSVIAAGMRALPLGVPKVLLSTAAGTDTSAYVGTKDIAMLPSVVDVAGINRVSRIVIARAAGAVVGMAQAAPPSGDGDKPIVAASMFGNTTACVDACREALGAKGYEVLVFHATGSGGKAMESLVDEGLVDAVLDITTTEWADEICGGVFSAGPHRLEAPGRARVPHLVVPGCIDMANFGGMETVPQKFRDAGRQFYEWNPSVTLMRTNADENRRMGEIFAEKINANYAAGAPIAVLIPLKGVSILDGDGERFCDREADAAFNAALKAKLNPEVLLVELDANINDPAFSAKAVAMLSDLIEKKN